MGRKANAHSTWKRKKKRIVVTNVTVDEYRNNKTVISNMSTRIEGSIKIMSLYNIFRLRKC